MSKSLFRQSEYGSYHFLEQIVEIRNDVLGLTPERAQEVLRSLDFKSMTDKDIEFYKTYIHESVHFIDSTTSLWGMEYTCRLYNCFNNNNSQHSINVFLLNDSEIEQHFHSRKVHTPSPMEYRTIRSILSYTPKYGAHIIFKYYNNEGKGWYEVNSTPLTMLALLEGHAYSQELLTAISIYKARDDHMSISLLKQYHEKMLKDKTLCEYTCILSFTEQLFEDYTFEEQLLIVTFVSQFALDLPALFHFPDVYVDLLFGPNTDEHIISAFKMELNRGMNRSSLIALILILLHSRLKARPIKSPCEFSKELENRLFEVFMKDGESIESCKQTFKTFHEISYETSLNLLHEKGAELAYLSAVANKGKDWFSFNLTEVFLPSALLTSGELLNANRELEYDIQELVFSDDKKIRELTKILKQENAQKPHLRPKICHDWLKKIEAGETGVHYYPEDF